LTEGNVPDELTPTRFAMERSLLVMGDRTELILVRHAQQRRTLSEAKQTGGPRLSDLGRDQARLTGEFLAAESTAPVEAVYCSDLNRTTETAQLIAAALAGQPQPRPDPGLREVDMYSRDRGGADVSAPVQAKAGLEFARTLRWDAFPNTEPGSDFRRRIVTALERIAQAHPGGRVVVVSHAGAISAAVAHLLGAEPDMFYFAGHASVNRLFYGDNRFVTHSLNEVGHLRAEGALTF
jgi:2,3-bisphosphoglycerate-dependent phosphoglycerate mutase